MSDCRALIGWLVGWRNQPTKATHRGWIVRPFANNPWWCFFAAVPPAMLATILIFMDQQITAVIVNRKENKLRVSEPHSGQLSLASLRGRLIEYQLRLGQGRECHLCRVAGNTV